MRKKKSQSASPILCAKPGGMILCETDLPPDVPFSLSCVVCDCDSPDSWFEAMFKGWTEIEYDPDGLSWNFLGYCPEHVGGRDGSEIS